MQDITIKTLTNEDGTSSAPVAYVWPSVWRDGQLIKVWKEAKEVKISVSHDGEYATAVCLAASEEAYVEKSGYQSAPTKSAKKGEKTFPALIGGNLEEVLPVLRRTENLKQKEMKRNLAKDDKKATENGPNLIEPSSSLTLSSPKPKSDVSRHVLYIDWLAPLITSSDLLLAFPDAVRAQMISSPGTSSSLKAAYLTFRKPGKALKVLATCKNGVEINGRLARLRAEDLERMKTLPNQDLGIKEENDAHENLEINPESTKQDGKLDVGKITLLLKPLSPSATVADILEAFSDSPKSGIIRAYIPRDQDPQKHRKGYILFKYKRAAARALFTSQNGIEIAGQMARVRPADSRMEQMASSLELRTKSRGLDLEVEDAMTQEDEEFFTNAGEFLKLAEQGEIQGSL
jgi:hypothetical protein